MYCPRGAHCSDQIKVLLEGDVIPPLLPTLWILPPLWLSSMACALCQHGNQACSLEFRIVPRFTLVKTTKLCRMQRLVTHRYTHNGYCSRMPSDTCCDACDQNQSGKCFIFSLMSFMRLWADSYLVNRSHSVEGLIVQPAFLTPASTPTYG